MKGNWKVGFQLSLLLITFWKEFQATKEKWKRDIVSFLIFFCSFQKLKKEKKKEEQKETKRIFPFFLIHVLQPSTLIWWWWFL